MEKTIELLKKEVSQITEKTLTKDSMEYMLLLLEAIEKIQCIQDENYSEEDTHNHDKICLSLDKIKKFYHEKDKYDDAEWLEKLLKCMYTAIVAIYKNISTNEEKEIFYEFIRDINYI